MLVHEETNVKKGQIAKLTVVAEALNPNSLEAQLIRELQGKKGYLGLTPHAALQSRNRYKLRS